MHYEKIHQNFSRTDLIFRIQKNVKLHALSCQKLAQNILNHQTYQSDPQTDIAIANLEHSIQLWIAENPHNLEVKNLLLILRNLKKIQEQFINLSREQNNYRQNYFQHQDNLNLLDDDIHDLPDLWLKLKQHL